MYLPQITTLTKKKDMLSMLAFPDRHAEQSVWVLTQKYNSVLKDLREQTRCVCLFHCKDRDSFEDCLRENDVIPSREQRELVRKQLAETKHAKLLLKTDQPVCYTVLSDDNDIKDDGNQADGGEPAGEARTDSVNWGAGTESC